MDFADKGVIKVKRIRKHSKCKYCKKKIPKGSWCYGNAFYHKVCLICERDKVFPSMIEGLDKLKGKLLREQLSLTHKWEKYDRDNILANLQDNG